MVLGDIQKLINEGHLKGEYTYTSESDEEYRFTFRTLSPIEEVYAERDSKTFYDQDKITRETDILVYRVNEILSRALISANGVPLQGVPGAEGTTDLDKKRFVVKRLGQQMVLKLWTKYNILLAKTMPQSTPEEAEQVKK